jgi:hypothetical protein
LGAIRRATSGGAIATPRKNVRAPREPVDPEIERRKRRFEEFEAQDAEGRIALFFQTLDDFELDSHELAYAMLERLHQDAVKSGNRTRFADCVEALRARQPKAFADGGKYFLCWCLRDALAEDRRAVIPMLARQLAGCAGEDIDVVNRSLSELAYHGHLPVLVEACRIAWPFVKSSKNVVPWGVSNFAEKGPFTRFSTTSNRRGLLIRPNPCCSIASGFSSRG